MDRHSHLPAHRPTSTLSIVDIDVERAATAAPFYIKPKKIDETVYRDAAFGGCSNPKMEGK